MAPIWSPEMPRRAFMAMMAGGFLAAPPLAEAQQAGKVYRIGFLSQGQPPKAFVEAIQQGLRERGYEEGRTSSGRSGRPTAAWTSFRDSPMSWCD